MKIIISPSKTQHEPINLHNYNYSNPIYENDSITINKMLLELLNTLNTNQLCKIFEIKNNDKLLDLTKSDILNFEKANKYPAIFFYDGLVFKNIIDDINNISKDQIEYLNQKLIILSCYYGVVKPFDLIKHYRLMFNSKFPNKEIDLIKYWKDKINNYFLENDNDNMIINLASLEYSQIIDRNKFNVVDIDFKVIKNNKIISKATLSKICRGQILNYISKNKIENIEEIKKFSYQGFFYNEQLSNDNTLIFSKQE